MTAFEEPDPHPSPLRVLHRSHEIWEMLEAHRRGIAMLLARTEERVHLVPSQRAAYAYVGRPPLWFEFFWINRDRVYAAERTSKGGDSAQTWEELCRAYAAHAPGERFEARLEGRRVTVIASRSIAYRLTEAVKKA